MVNLSFDPDAKTLYWYFTEIDSGSTASEGECDGTILLDGDGEIIGLELELDESVTATDLALALSHPGVFFDAEQFILTVQLIDEEPASVQPLHDPIILDFDQTGRLQGCEVSAAETFGLGKRLTRVALCVIILDEDDTSPTFVGDEAEDDDETELAEAELDLDAESSADDETEEEQSDDEEEKHAGPQRTSIPPIAPFVRGSVVPGYKSGFVALVGPPNAGKSTLLNALLGQKVAIVSPLPQTTRTAIRGILHRPEAQIIFVDTPGIHQPRTRLGNFMVDQARRAIPASDVVCMLVDITRPPGKLDEKIAEMVQRTHAPKILVMNKVDQRNPHGLSHIEAYRNLAQWDMELAISALKQLGLETLIEQIVARLPAEQPLYPEDQITDQSERELASELIREQVLRFTQQEVPHGVAVEVEEWEQREGALYIRMSIYVEKDSQKGILIGAGGQMLKQIGSRARQNIESSLGQTVYLDLWVKTRANWRDDPNALHWLGYKHQK
jgi:GTP-binding protein Era